MNFIKYSFIILLFSVFITKPRITQAQQRYQIKGIVTDAGNGDILPGVTVQLVNTKYATVTDDNGNFVLSVPKDKYKLRVSFVGYATLFKSIDVGKSVPLVLKIALSPEIKHLSGVEVSSLPISLTEAKSGINPERVREANVRDVGGLLRQLQGVNAVRRGPLGLDPVVRGMRESEVGFYVNGTREFPAGPARMDNALDHYDPDNVKSVHVVKGPYALTWGPGNLSAVSVVTQPVPQSPDTGLLHGKLATGYNTNLNSVKTMASLFGRKGKFGYLVRGTWRQGADYTSGNGTLVPAHFHERELRGKVLYAFSSNSILKAGGGVQGQNGVDYPGSLLNAAYFHSYDMNADWTLKRPGKLLRKVEVQGYFNRIRHRMTNDGKPTALPDSTRMPPFPLNIYVIAESMTSGGKASFTLEPNERWEIELGGNFFSNYRKAARIINRRDMYKHLFTNTPWPGATVSMGGIYGRATHHFNDWLSMSGTLREDLINNHVDDSVSEFFLQNVSTHLKANHAVWSGAATLSATPSDHWVLSLGLGSAARSADATELYSDRFQGSKAQMSAEFVGNPQLKPERSYEADISAEAGYGKVSFSVDLFGRYMHHYITITPTDLPKELPVDPPVVYAYVNGKAEFWGGEFAAAYQITPVLSLHVGSSYLWGKDMFLHEPALGVSPFRTDTRLRYQDLSGKLYLEGLFHTSATQNRVAAKKGEIATSGYYTIGLRGGIHFTHGLSLQAGVDNLTDQQYTDHLNSRNPYTGRPVPEPGIVCYGSLAWSF